MPGNFLRWSCLRNSTILAVSQNFLSVFPRYTMPGNISQTFPKHFPKIPQTFPKDFPKISQTFPKHYPALHSTRYTPCATLHALQSALQRRPHLRLRFFEEDNFHNLFLAVSPFRTSHALHSLRYTPRATLHALHSAL